MHEVNLFGALQRKPQLGAVSLSDKKEPKKGLEILYTFSGPFLFGGFEHLTKPLVF